MSGGRFTISELAREFVLTPRAIRHYEELGLLHPGKRGTVRLFSESDRKRLRLVLRGKRLGFSLEQIKEMLDLHYAQSGEIAAPEALLSRIEGHRVALRRLREDVGMALSWLEMLEERCRGDIKKSA
ncbi:MAG: MerR family transcriptional regulator [Alphaproteobacteria bacterium]